jgi:site-specific recombinase XerD
MFISKVCLQFIASLKFLMTLTGHNSITTTQRYIEITPTVMKADVELI